MSREAAPTPISFRDIARKVRFRQHPTLTACWIWQGRFQDEKNPKTGSGLSARQDVHERIMGFRPGGKITLVCDVSQCVNPHHVKGPS